MKDFLSNKYFLLVLRLVIGAVFIYASYDKLLNPEEFAKAVNNYKILPYGMVNIMAIVIPYIELFTGILLIFGLYTRGSAMVFIILLIVFIAALVNAQVRGLDISCGCFSLETSSEKGDILIRIIEDILLLAGTIIVYIYSNRKEITNTNNNINNINNRENLTNE